MPSESGDRVPASLQQQTGKQQPQPETESLPCPRCDSTSTKFCYYNNYNLHQPRHFCKSCRRYWTQGGTLRNVPVGGGTRKGSTSTSTNKRSRTSSSATSASSSSSSTVTHDPTPANPINMVPGPKTQMFSPFIGDLNLNESAGSGAGGFTTLLNNQSNGFCGLGGFGLGSGFHEMGFGLGMAVWPMEQVHHEGNGGGVGGGRVCGDSPGGFNTWQMGGGVEGGLADDDCFGWPDLAISTPSNCLK